MVWLPFFTSKIIAVANYNGGENQMDQLEVEDVIRACSNGNTGMKLEMEFSIPSLHVMLSLVPVKLLEYE